MPDPKAVNSMFARIAGSYDIANHLLSGGVDYWWRQRLVRLVHDTKPSALLDLATGSGDVAFALADGLPEGARITGMDFCQPMLDEAVKKQAGYNRWSGIEFRQGDGMALPLPDQTFDVVTISFGLRNMADRHKSLSEMRRVLRPGGRLFVLEFSQPFFWFRPVYYAYLKFVLPLVAGIVTGDRSAYEYLCGSIEKFPNREAMSMEISRAGFTVVRAMPLTFGIVALHEAVA
ncbi:bifunctional demethylmenaquinone methyltransferase/2-methoxy-6-polyprenyl-1,4-benzoquinol methylase UbiE [Oleiharenicola lentus]|jgi:demethylmenaquinone methyltransferase/2-methoxy-6-polyprenyl-1,4-benzoquinol methylase|uniref:Demethylmenaquinone methyltransferase n=1 Tax=Oleiharenicola lentus TaxID=2508720 RepID=A0A4Q1CBH5_9BACT|nr:bifunctional demethylmenaquinone methyltransferase/2-methoxy-6-polyprenyl-1,4-benzoquinol methylase UbiE [Oleiharenicola lentus]RXK56453.1 bifunctional demethylmenaquinone methyltransferase/2-methoxy-6-polyprenyl-1,4-benzoquinol methylase UbiE [Oleiharenicola lentus]